MARIGARIGGFVVRMIPAFRTGPFASLASLDVGVKLLPLLKGRVDVEEITLRDPVILVLKKFAGAAQCLYHRRETHGSCRALKARGPRTTGRQSAPSAGAFAVDRVSIDGGS